MAKDNFAPCLAFVLKWEGGYSNDPRDPGGATLNGVTQATYSAYRRAKHLDPVAVREMSHAERDEIYRTGYWDKIGGDDLRPGEDLAVFDFAVNSGPDRALRVWIGAGRKAKTGAAAASAVCSQRESFLHGLRTWQFFGKGWHSRVAACEAAAIKMAGVSTGPPMEKAKRDAKDANYGIATAIAAAIAGLVHVWDMIPGWGLAAAAAISVLVIAVMLSKRQQAKAHIEALAKEANSVVVRFRRVRPFHRG